MKLRPYQEQAIEAIFKEWLDGRKRTLLVLPTGTGKTIVFCKLGEQVVREGGRVLILAHREELLKQAADKLDKSTGLKCSIEKAESTSIGEWYRVVVGSVQTLTRKPRLEQFTPDHFDTIIVDEAHHVLSPTYLNVLNYFTANVLGVTATPDRGDRKSLGRFFESLAFEYSLPQAIKDGFLCPIKAQTIPINIDMTGVSTKAGDYQASDVASALDPYLRQIVHEVIARAGNRKTVIFTPLIATSVKLQDFFKEEGVNAIEVNGDSDDRAELLERFDKADKGAVLINSMLLTEGWDCPSVDCVIVLRATKVRGLYSQMIGRGTRLCEGKESLLILDFLWHTSKHELCRPASLMADDEEVAEVMTEMTEAASGIGDAIDIMEATDEARLEVVRTREEQLAERLESLRKKKAKLVDPLAYEMSLQDESLVNYVPTFEWEQQPPTTEQVDALFKLDISAEGITSAGKADALINAVHARKEQGLATPKQIRCLEQRGFKHVGTWATADAKHVVDRIAANNWRVPYSIGKPSEYLPKQMQTNKEEKMT